MIYLTSSDGRKEKQVPAKEVSLAYQTSYVDIVNKKFKNRTVHTTKYVRAKHRFQVRQKNSSQ